LPGNRINDKINKFRLPEPMDYGEIIDRTLEIYKEHFRDFALVSLILFGPVVFLAGILVLLLSFLSGGKGSSVIQAVLSVFVIFSSIISIFFVAANINITYKAFQGKRISYLDALRQTIGKIGALLLTTLVAIVLIGAAVSFAFGMFFFTTRFLGGSIPEIILGVIMIAIGIYVVLYTIFSFVLAPCVVMIEDMRGLQALKRSHQLFRSSRNTIGKVILIPYLMNILTQILAVIASFIPFVGIIVMALLFPLQIIAISLVYFDVRIRYEGLDLLLLAERLNEKLEMEEAALPRG